MATAGRKSKPAGLKLIEGRGHGRDSGGRLVRKPPMFKRLPPVMPKSLRPTAVEWWEAHVPELVRLDLVKASDAPALAMAAETYATWIASMAMVQTGGLLLDGKQGLVTHPAVRLATEAAREYRAWCAEFGLTPAAEMKVAKQVGVDGDEDSPFG